MPPIASRTIAAAQRELAARTALADLQAQIGEQETLVRRLEAAVADSRARLERLTAERLALETAWADLRHRAQRLAKRIDHQLDAASLPPDPITDACRALELDRALVTAARRTHESVRARWAVIRHLHQAGHSAGEIGRLLGRHHSTIIYALRAARP